MKNQTRNLRIRIVIFFSSEHLAVIGSDLALGESDCGVGTLDFYHVSVKSENILHEEHAVKNTIGPVQL